MPEVKRQLGWEVLFREDVSGIATGWTVREDYGKVRLAVRGRGRASESVTLPFSWEKSCRPNTARSSSWEEKRGCSGGFSANS